MGAGNDHHFHMKLRSSLPKNPLAKTDELYCKEAWVQMLSS